MALFRSSTDNYSGEPLTNTDANTSSSTPTPPLDQVDNPTSLITQIGDDEELLILLSNHTLSRPSDWVRLLRSILFTQGRNSILACLSLLYIIARLPLAGWSMYQTYSFAIGSTTKGIAVMIVVLLIWILEKEIGFEKRCWDVLVGIGRVWIVEERRRREMEAKRLRRWEEREQRQMDERAGWDWNGKDEDYEDVSLEAWIGEACMLRDDERSFYEGGELDTTELLWK